MKNLLVTATPFAAAVLLSVAARPSDDSVKLRWAPATGTTVEHEIKISSSVQGGDLSVKMGGNEVPSQFLPKLSFAYANSTGVTIRDEFLEAEEGITGPWRRRTVTEADESFTMELDMDGELSEYSAEGNSDLEGTAFLIGRDEDGDKVARWDGGESDLPTALLESQRPELDLKGLLSEDAVSAGDTWEADASALANVLDVSRSLPWTWNTDDSSNVPTAGSCEWKGGLELAVKEITNEDGVMLCVVAITGEAIETVVKAGDLSQVPVADGAATDTATTTYQVEGEFTWNVSAGHLVSFDLTGEGEGEQVTEKEAGQPGPEYSSTTQHTAELTVELR